MARGGRRTPASPAPVSGPGGLSRRTDGGPAPALSSTGGRPYGERQALEAQEAAAPTGPSPGPAIGGGGGAAPGPVRDLWRPTERPFEPAATGGAGPVRNPMAQNPQAALRVLYAKFPHPAIARLIDWSAYGSHPPR